MPLYAEPLGWPIMDKFYVNFHTHSQPSKLLIEAGRDELHISDIQLLFILGFLFG